MAHVHEYKYCNDQQIPQLIHLSFIVLSLLITVPISLIGYAKLAKARVFFIFKYIFYACTLFGFIELSGFLTTVILCHYNLESLNKHWLYISVSVSFIAYGLMLSHIPFLWLLRLYHTFYGSLYEKPNLFYIVITIIISVMILFASAGFVLFMLYDGFYRHIGMILGLSVSVGYLLISVFLPVVFLRSLYQLTTHRVATIHFETAQTLKRKTRNINLSSNEQVFVDCISKYLILGTLSFSSTVIVIVIAWLYFLHILPQGDAQLLKLAVIVDVVNNILCIYLQCNHASETYDKICGCCNFAITSAVERKASIAISSNTYSFYSQQFGDFGPSERKLVDINEEDEEDQDALLVDL